MFRCLTETQHNLSCSAISGFTANLTTPTVHTVGQNLLPIHRLLEENEEWLSAGHGPRKKKTDRTRPDGCERSHFLCVVSHATFAVDDGRESEEDPLSVRCLARE